VRVLLFTGKGGVGKTTVAAATALHCAAGGRRTIVISTDPAHSLADCLDVGLGSSPTRVAERLDGMQMDATERLEESWGELQDYLVELFGWAGLNQVEAEELVMLPGLEELFALSDIKELADSGAYDVVVVDCAPTADTIRLLSLPNVLGWYMQRIFPVERRVLNLVRPVVKRVTSIPVASDAVFRSGEALYGRLEAAHALLSDSARSSLRLVVNPERMVVAEARRTATYLGLFGYHVDAVVANRLIPDAVTDPWFKAWKATHADHLEAIEQGFAPLPVLRADLAADELVGLPLLAEFAASLYGERDPAAVMHAGEALKVVVRGEERVLCLELPFLDSDELEVGRHGDELLVRVGPYRRALMLPDSLRRRAVSGATVRDDWLEIAFTEADR